MLDKRMLMLCSGVIAAGLVHALLQEQLIYAMPVRWCIGQDAGRP